VSYPAVLMFLSGAIVTAFLACGVFFLKFWWRSRDLLFAAFAAAFWLLALNAGLVALAPQHGEARSWFYLPRIAAFSLITLAVIGKNAMGGRTED
jgi:Family of unknown function (DUF5985)